MSNYNYAEVREDGRVDGVMQSTTNYIKFDSSLGNVENCWYNFDTESFVEKTELVYELEIDGLTASFRYLPEGLDVLVNGWSVDRTRDEDFLHIELDGEGNHSVKFSGHAKFFDKEITIEID